jgi:DMSO/TMAO reductase YedYZ molybdopterin-dependent catalytic subunit
MSPSGERPIILWAAGLSGALAGGIATAASELLAGLIGGVPSLVVAVGVRAIALQPPGAERVMVALFGTNDKVALNLMVVAATIAIGGAAGIIAARRFWAGATIFGVFGIMAAAAAVQEPLVAPLPAVANAILAVAAGLVGLRLLLSRAPRRIEPGEVEARLAEVEPENAGEGQAAAGTEGIPFWMDEGPIWTRRRFLIASAATLGSVTVGGAIGRLLIDAQHPEGVLSTSRLPAALNPVPPLSADESLNVPGLGPIVVPNDKFFRVDINLLVPEVDLSTWRLQVKGMVDHPLTFTYDQLLAMPLFEQYVTLACVSNPVGGTLVGNTLWTGVRLKDVLASAGVQPGATQIVGRSVDDFTVGFPTAWATAPEREPMIAVGMNRLPLPASHGFPARLIVPGLFGYVSATKWLSSIELTTREAVDGYWIPLGWAKDGPILTQSRIDVPAAGAHLSPGPIELAGIAWAPDRGVSKVEVNFDSGPWQAATISRPISKATWVHWQAPWSATSGRHTIEVRATDDTGEVQPDVNFTGISDIDQVLSDPAPNGAHGHHRIFVQVA